MRWQILKLLISYLCLRRPLWWLWRSELWLTVLKYSRVWDVPTSFKVNGRAHLVLSGQKALRKRKILVVLILIWILLVYIDHIHVVVRKFNNLTACMRLNKPRLIVMKGIIGVFYVGGRELKRPVQLLQGGLLRVRLSVVWLRIVQHILNHFWLHFLAVWRWTPILVELGVISILREFLCIGWIHIFFDAYFKILLFVVWHFWSSKRKSLLFRGLKFKL